MSDSWIWYTTGWQYGSSSVWEVLGSALSWWEAHTAQFTDCESVIFRVRLSVRISCKWTKSPFAGRSSLQFSAGYTPPLNCLASSLLLNLYFTPRPCSTQVSCTVRLHAVHRRPSLFISTWNEGFVHTTHCKPGIWCITAVLIEKALVPY